LASGDSTHQFESPGFGIAAKPQVMLGIIPDYGSVDSRVGVLISGTRPGSPAAVAGLHGGDLLVQFGSRKLENLMDLSEALARSKPGDKIVLKLIRDKATLSLHVTLAERKG
jgi:S1-C subfamily serine protease